MISVWWLLLIPVAIIATAWVKGMTTDDTHGVGLGIVIIVATAVIVALVIGGSCYSLGRYAG